MEFKEAIEKVIDVIPAEKLSEFDEVIETLKSGTIQTGNEDWKARYEELSEIYKKRFKESLNTEVKTEIETDEDLEEPEAVNVDSLDFNADSE